MRGLKMTARRSLVVSTAALVMALVGGVSVGAFAASPHPCGSQRIADAGGGNGGQATQLAEGNGGREPQYGEGNGGKEPQYAEAGGGNGANNAQLADTGGGNGGRGEGGKNMQLA